MTSRAAPGPTRRRLQPAERRAQLLDAAAEILSESGPRALTMERLALRIGVSKGLGYAYFKDAQDVALALWDREVGDVYRRVEAAMAGAASLEDGLRAAVVCYFDIVAERGAMLAALQSRFGGTELNRRIEYRVRDFLGFWVERVREAHGVAKGPASTLSAMLVSSVEVAARTWGAGLISRERAERLCVAFIREGLKAAALEAGGAR